MRSNDGAPGDKARILFVDDDAMLLRTYTRAFTSAGYAVTTATDGATAMELVEREKFDVIFTDVHMPDLDGPELVRAVRAKDAAVPIVLLTGAPTNEGAKEAEALGVMLYLGKPVRLQAMLQAAEQALASRAT